MYDWKAATHEWLSRQRWLEGLDPTLVITFFERAFRHAQNPEEAWFGTHGSAASLVGGQLYLAALHTERAGRGVWLLISEPPDFVSANDLVPVEAIRSSERSLSWLVFDPRGVLEQIVQEDTLWDSYAEATARLVEFGAGRGRDGVHRKHGKYRLSEFWAVEPSASLTAPDAPLSPYDATLREGTPVVRRTLTYERNPRARARCIEAHGTRCSICGLDFGEVYGPEFEGYIHVHHTRPLSTIGEEYEVDPVEDMRPVCPNCHVVIHHGGTLRKIDEMRDRLEGAAPVVFPFWRDD